MNSIRLHDRLFSLDSPKVMAILNVTPDSFYAGSRVGCREAAEERVRRFIEEGADMIDIGGYSSRPGADDVSPDEEFHRLAQGIEATRRIAPELPVSVDTFRSDVARKCVEEFGVEIINDIGGGDLDPKMFETVAELGCAYILMHMRGTPATMQQMTDYDDVTAEVLSDMSRKIARLRQLGVADVIADPGFGFAKTTAGNFKLMRDLKAFRLLDAPLLVGISRKTMIWKTLGITPDQAGNGTTVLNTMALMNGADILRVHDVRPAVEAVKLVAAYNDAAKETI